MKSFRTFAHRPDGEHDKHCRYVEREPQWECSPWCEVGAALKEALTLTERITRLRTALEAVIARESQELNEGGRIYDCGKIARKALAEDEEQK